MPTFDFILAGRYKLVAPLGEGGMAAVYRARDLRLNRDVAVKVLHESLTQDPSFLSRFEREAQFVASLSHPNIVPVYDVGEEKGTHFIVMEYVRGRTLKDAIEVEGRLTPDRAIEVMRRVLDALSYAHGRGLIHRDIKPQNILLTPDGTPRLADFGIAYLSDGSTTRTAAILGSAQYLSPEQSRGEEATVQSDLYACGIVLFEMLAGKPPFDGPNALAVANKHLHAAPPSLRAGVPAVTASLEKIVLTALQKEPRLRFGDAPAFADSLEQCVLDDTATTTEQPLGNHAVTSLQPLAAPPAVLRAAQDKSGARPITADAPFVVRRSTRKTFLLALLLGVAVFAGLYASNLPIWGQTVGGQPVPAYPSQAYALLPAFAAALIIFSWIRTRSWVYTMNQHAAIVQWGLVGHHRFGIPLRQITSLELKQSPIDRVIGIGTIELCARDADGTERHLVMEDVPRPRAMYDDLMHLLSQSARTRPLPSQGQLG